MERNLVAIRKFAQSIHLAMYKRYFDDIEGADGIVYTDQVMDWTNQLIPEIELEADWNFSRQNSYPLGTVNLGARQISVSDDIRKLVVSEYRPLVIAHDGIVISEWDVVNPNAIADPRDPNTNDRVTFLGGNVIFSRPINENEANGTAFADIINPIPELTTRDISILETVKPAQLLVLGVAKNATLPDIVQGGISPSMAQKYADLLEKSIAENNAQSISLYATRESFGYIGGIN